MISPSSRLEAVRREPVTSRPSATKNATSAVEENSGDSVNSKLSALPSSAFVVASNETRLPVAASATECWIRD